MKISRPFKLALLASGEGTNAEVIIRYFDSHPKISVCLVLSNNQEAHVLAKATALGIPCKVFDKRQFREVDEVITWLQEEKITHLVLAGFLWLVPQIFIQTFHNRIINIHPSLLPKFGGKGMFGKKVHEAVKASGEKETGITIHQVNEHFDEGEILFQQTCKIDPMDTLEDIAKKVHVLEYEYFPKVIEKWVLKEL